MHNFAYIPVEEELFSQELGNYRSCGMEVFENGSLHYKVSDISADENLMRVLARRCTDGLLDPIRLFDVIEDRLGG